MVHSAQERSIPTEQADGSASQRLRHQRIAFSSAAAFVSLHHRHHIRAPTSPTYSAVPLLLLGRGR